MLLLGLSVSVIQSWEVSASLSLSSSADVAEVSVANGVDFTKSRGELSMHEQCVPGSYLHLCTRAWE